MRYYQQGDVLIMEKSFNSKNMKRLPHLTLARGEVTFHHHTITEGEAELYEKEGVLYLHVESESATLTHQEHNPVTIPKGDWEIGIVQEFDHLEQEQRNVRD